MHRTHFITVKRITTCFCLLFLSQAIVTSHTHLRTIMSPISYEVSKFVKAKIAACKTIAYTIPAIGSRRAPVTPICGTHVYNSICLSKLLYGVEMLKLSDSVIMDLESFQASAAKLLQGLPAQTCNIGAVRTLGWLSIQSQIDYNKLVFLWR